jgi:hypothetical protein
MNLINFKIFLKEELKKRVKQFEIEMEILNVEEAALTNENTTEIKEQDNIEMKSSLKITIENENVEKNELVEDIEMLNEDNKPHPTVEDEEENQEEG